MGFGPFVYCTFLLAPLGWVHDLAPRGMLRMRYDESNEILMMIVCFIFGLLRKVKGGRGSFLGAVVWLARGWGSEAH